MVTGGTAMPTAMGIRAHSSTRLPFRTMWLSQNRNPYYCCLPLLLCSFLAKLFPLLISLWTFQTTLLMSYTLLPQIISTGISTYKLARWVHPLFPKGPSLLSKRLATKIMTEKDVDILHPDMFFSLSLRLCLHHHTAFLSLPLLSRGRCRSSPEQAGLSTSGRHGLYRALLLPILFSLKLP